MYEESIDNISTLDDSFQIEQYNQSPLFKISSILSKIISQNESFPQSSVFSANEPPKISLFDYLTRIKTYGEISDSTLVLSLILIDRFCEMNSVLLTAYNIHKILFVSVLIFSMTMFSMRN